MTAMPLFSRPFLGQAKSFYKVPVLVIVLVLSNVLLSLLVSPIYDDLPWWLSGALLSRELLLCLVVLTPLAFVKARGLQIAYLFIVCALLLSSWVAFYALDQFLSFSAFKMLEEDWRQLFRHALQMAGWQLLLLPFILIAIYLWWPKKFKVNRYVLVGVLYIPLGFYLSSFFYAEEAGGQSLPLDNGAVMPPSEAMDYYGATKVGPVSALASEVQSYLAPDQFFYNEETVKELNVPIKEGESYLDNLSHYKKGFADLNLVFITIESLRYDQISAFGGDADVMPNLNKLAGKSLRFHNNYGQSSHSSYADLVPLSSSYPLRSPRTYFYPENPNYPRTMPWDLLKRVGYRSAVISSQNEYWGGMYNFLKTPSLDNFLHAENYQGHVRDAQKEFNPWILGKGRRAGKLDDRDTISELIRWIDKESEKRFVSYTNLQSSHYPFELPDNYHRQFAVGDLYDGNKVPNDTPDEAIRIAYYKDALHYIDEQIGRLVSYLDNKGLLNKTLFVINGDTAFAFKENRYWGNGATLDEAVIRVPLLIVDPRLNNFKDIKSVSRQLDVMPTVLSLLGLPPYPGYQGHSLLHDQAVQNVFAVSQTPVTYQYSVMADGWKLIYDKRSGYYLLFDLEKDPNNIFNVMSQHQEIGLALANRLHAWMSKQLDYYGDIGQQKRFYPPVLKFDDNLDVLNELARKKDEPSKDLLVVGG